MSKEKLIPELRFPEFVKEGEWDENVLSKITDAIFDGTHQTPTYTEEGIPFFSVENLVSGNKNKFISQEEYKIATSKNKPEKGDILITRIGKIGFSAIVDWDYEFSIYVTLACVKKSEHFNSYYLHSYFQSDTYQKEILSKSLLNAVPCKINMNELRETRVLLPNLQEQQKIASCLSSLDELIAAHNDKLQALKDHKKGLMQNLFPQEGEKVPKFRFPEFEKDGEWKLKPLDEICKLVRGPFGGALKKEIFVNEGYAVYEQSHAIYSDFNSFRYRINDIKFSELKRFAVKAGDLIMSCSGTMGKFAVIPDNFEQGVINQALLKLTAKKGYNNSFVKISLETNTNQKNLLSQSAGGAIKNVVSVSQIREFELAIPKPKEQQKIASCLSSLDELITAQSEKIEQLQQHKKGLMQGLFP